jgi:hypothetical protein
MRINILALILSCISLYAQNVCADAPTKQMLLFEKNDKKCIPAGVIDLPAFKGNQAVSGNCSVTAVVSGKVKDVSDYYFDIYQKRGWDVANRVQTELENRFTVQKKKNSFSISFVQVSQENTSIEFSY